MKRLNLAIVLVGALLLASGCKPKPASLQVEPSQLKFTATGETMMLLVTVLDKEGKPLEHKPCLFASTDTSVASVQQDGTVAAIGAGTASIRVACEELAAVAAVKVRLPTTIKLELECDKRCNLLSSDPLSFKLEGLGASAVLKSEVLDDDGQPVEAKVSYEARDPDYHSGVRNLGIEVSEEGRVTARGVGKFMILAHAGGAVNKLSVEVTMPVVDVVKAEKSSVWLKPGEKTTVNVSTFQRTIHGVRTVQGARLAWQSSDKKVATVDDDGVIEAHSEGFADVVVASDSGAFAQVAVRVDNRGKPTLKPTGKKSKKTLLKRPIRGKLPRK